MEEHRRAQHGPPSDWEHDFVFRFADGTLNYHEMTRRAFHDDLRTAGLPFVRVHDLQHSFATWSLENGVNIVKVADILGHSSREITKRVYGQVTRRMDQQVLSITTDLFRRMTQELRMVVSYVVLSAVVGVV